MIIDEEKILNKDYYDEELALAYLLTKGILFINNIDVSKTYKDLYKEPTYTTAIFVKCSDVFYYSTADAECLSNSDGDYTSEIISLYKMTRENLNYGYIKFCSLKRKIRPLKEIVKLMKQNKYWDQELENLPENLF